jgi:parvulin-like peptidyl-prolyl isomerase
MRGEKMKSKYLIYILLCFVVVLFTGCPKNEQGRVMAKVNGDVITENEFVKALPRGFASDSMEQAYRKSLIDRMIVKRLFIQEAKKLGMDKELQFSMEKDMQTILIQALYDDVVTKNVKINSQEIESAKKLLLTEVHLKSITVPDENVAQVVSDEIKKGAVFESLAVKFSQDPAAANGGDMGFMPALYLEPAVREQVLKMKPGDVSAPIETEEGFRIVSFLDKQMKTDSGTDLKERARQFVEQEKSSKLAREYLKKIDERLEYNPEGLRVFHKNFDQMTPADGEIWVVKKDKKKIVYAKNLMHIAQDFPNLLDTLMREYAVKRTVEEDVLYEDALDRKLDKNPATKSQVEQRTDDLLYERFFLTQINQKVDITDKEIEDYFQMHKDKYSKSKLDEVKSVIRQELFAPKRQEIYQQTVDNLKSQAKIDINDKLVMSVKKAIKK